MIFHPQRASPKWKIMKKFTRNALLQRFTLILGKFRRLGATSEAKRNHEDRLNAWLLYAFVYSLWNHEDMVMLVTISYAYFFLQSFTLLPLPPWRGLG